MLDYAIMKQLQIESSIILLLLQLFRVSQGMLYSMSEEGDH